VKKDFHEFFNSKTFSALWWISAAHSARLPGGRLVALVYSHRVNNSKALSWRRWIYHFLYRKTLKFFNSSLAFSATPFSLSGGFSEHTQRGSRGYVLMGINSRASSIVDSLFLQDIQ